MKSLDPGERIFLPLILSIRADTAECLSEMAIDMEITLDDLLSTIAEDSANCLKKKENFLEDVHIPDKCSTQDLLHRFDI